MSDGGEQGRATLAASARRGCACGRPPRTAPAPSCCVSTRDTPVRKPDLAIYSQEERLAAGAPPSWDNPDIVTNDWRPFRLKNEAEVTVRNLSTVPAANAQVHFFTAPFGIGTRRQLRLTRLISLAPGGSAMLLFPLHQEVLAGDPRTAVHVRIDHPTDANLLNNAGSQVHDGGYTTESGRTFSVSVPVLNDSGESRQIDLVILPTNLICSVTPASRLFAPFEQFNVTLNVQVPPFITGTGANPAHTSVTVLGRLAVGGGLIGGVTRLLRVDN
jgi:hypothetical protein